MANEIPDIGNLIAAIGALGTAAYGLVDASKVVRGGPSNYGFAFIRDAMKPFEAVASQGERSRTDRVLKANWLNGVAVADQKAAAKSMIRLGLTQGTAAKFASLTHVDGGALSVAAQHTDDGTPLTQQDLNVLGRFDAELSAILDAAYGRADQKYRNAAKAWACGVAVVIAVAAGALISPCLSAGATTAAATGGACSSGGQIAWLLECALLGLIATPLAPIAKDLSTTFAAAATAIGNLRK